MKKRIWMAMLSAAMFVSGPQALASGIPTVDAAAIAQALLTLEQLKTTYDQIVRQYNQAVMTYQSMTGNRGMGMLYYNPSLRQFLPDNFDSRLKNVIANGVGSLSSRAKEIYSEQKMAEACSNLASAERLSCEKEQAARAEFQSALEAGRDSLNQKYDNIVKLQEAISSTNDQKAIEELSARIQSEQSTLAASHAAANYELALARERIEQSKRDEALKAHQIFFGSPSQ